MRNKGLMAGLIEGTTMVNNPFNKALFVMEVPYTGAPVDWPKKLRPGSFVCPGSEIGLVTGVDE